jgi:hypothetical protein
MARCERIYLILFLLVLFFECVDGEKGIGLAPFWSKFSSVKMVGKKGCVPKRKSH